MSFRNIASMALAAIAGFFMLTILFGSWYTIDETERGVLLRNGAFVRVVQPGLGFKMPWIESVYRIDMKTHTYTYGKDEKTGFSTMEAYSLDQQPAKMRVSVTIHIKPDKVAEMYSRFAGDYNVAVSRSVVPNLYAQTKVVFGRYTAQRAISERGQLNTAAKAALAESMSYDPVFEIEGVQIEDISFSGDYIRSVEQRMQAEVEVQRLRQNLEREKVQATIVVTQAQAQADSTVARAKAEADAIKLRGDAEAQAIQARGKALGENPSLVALVQAEKWNGILPQTMIPGGSVPMLALSK